ncbi:hypothetical protein CEUSTIGMA_g5448.t1 [Chlamydomonas eustigma]|uniref:polynucleotide adenylyltransferase n=1 Tax=Chlamydomonas eustigma TaxID=1157962 RepID=A0A250X4M0_9CHLO|nr:hypothetical protein CEUSTIGMA_g5448.t1 [Chlamydomonas eustigma]|eukprot:GAX78006.1 hypothetical protein CEUSTIGMA_g5448.t1 [Chlamydomonas eustigma]
MAVVTSDCLSGLRAPSAPKDDVKIRDAITEDEDDDPERGNLTDATFEEDRPEYIPIPALQNVVEDQGAARNRSSGTAGDVDEETSAKSMQASAQRPYWMSQCSHLASPLLRLHQEIVFLVELLHPTPQEEAERKDAVAAVTEVIKTVFPEAQVEVFGSFATGLYVPTSDVDLVVLNTQIDVQTGLKALANQLSRKGVAKGIQVIGKAKVPIIKFETVNFGGLAFDISFNVPNGPQAAELVKEVIHDWPMIRPMVLVLKLFLQQRELNEVYTGGIGSYALITMLIAFLQLHNSRRRAPAQKPGHKARPPASQLEPSLGVLLIDFFRLYGRVINVKDVGISATGGGHYFVKENKDGSNWVTEGREYMLSVEDPKDPNNDICRSSFNIMRVKGAFDFAYQQLAAPSRPDESLLQRILRLGPILASRSRPVNPSLQYPLRNAEHVHEVAQDGPKEAVTGKKRRHTDPSKEKCREGRNIEKEQEEEGEVAEQDSMEHIRRADRSFADHDSAGQASRWEGREEGASNKRRKGTSEDLIDQAGDQHRHRRKGASEDLIEQAGDQQRHRRNENWRQEKGNRGAETGIHRGTHLPARGLGTKGGDREQAADRRRGSRDHDPKYVSERTSHDVDHRKRQRSNEEPTRHYDHWRGYGDRDETRDDAYPRSHELPGRSSHHTTVQQDQSLSRWSHSAGPEEVFGTGAAFVPGYGGGGGGRGGTRNPNKVVDAHSNGDRKYHTQQRPKHIRFH